MKKTLARRILQGMLVLIAVCSWSTAVHAGGTFQFPLFYASNSLDPVKDQLVSTFHVVQQVYDGLVAYDNNLRIIPGLAESWRVSRDGKQYEFTLRKGIRFHNGREVTAEDVVASLSRLLKPENETSSKEFLYRIKGAREFGNGETEEVAGIRIVSDHRIVIELVEPYAPFLSTLAMPITKIVPKEMILDPGQPLTMHPVGTGPFRFDSWKGDTIILKANRDYFRGPPQLDEIRFRYYTGEMRNQAFPDFLDGKLSGCPLPESADLDKLKSRGYRVLIRPRLSLMFYGMNLRMPPLNDPYLRKALCFAFDRGKYAAQVLDSRHHPAFQILPLGMPGYSPDNALAFYDKDMAKESLNRSEYPKGEDPPELVLASVSHSAAAKSELEMFRLSLAELGIRLIPLFIETWEEFKEGLENGQYSMYRYAIHADVPDPDDLIPGIVETHGSHNFTGYSNPEVDSMIRQARGETNPVRRISLYRDVEKKVLEDLPLIPVVFISTQVVFQPNVKNIELPATGTPYLPLSTVTISDGS